MAKPKVLVEICCGSVDDAVEAEAGGAHRVELCSALFLGGLTPSLGVLSEAIARVKIPVMAMIRPRPGGFCYSEAEFAAMMRDVDLAAACGASGVVFGILNEDGQVDIPRCRRLVAHAGTVETVFHRAFDVTPDPLIALETLIELGFDRVLTSGQRVSAPEGADLIAALVARSSGRIEVLPGGGIRPENAAELLARTGCNQVHLTAHRSIADSSTRLRPEIRFGDKASPPEDVVNVVDRKRVADIVAAVRA